MTTFEVAKRTGVRPGTLSNWIKDGAFVPAGGVSFGSGDRLYLDERDVQRVRVIAAIRKDYGDGQLARDLIGRLVPMVTADTKVVGVPEYELAL